MLQRKMVMIGVAVAASFFLLGLASQSARCDILEEVFKRIAYVDLEKVFQEYNKKKDIESKLQKEWEGEQTKLGKMMQELEGLKDEYEKQAPLLTEEAKRERQQEINRKIEEYRALQKKIFDQKQTREQKYTQELLQDIINKVKEIAEKEGYIYVFDKAALIYGAPTQDITEKIITELNKEYEKGKNE